LSRTAIGVVIDERLRGEGHPSLSAEPFSTVDLRARIAVLEAEIRGLKAALAGEPPQAAAVDDRRFRETFQRAAAGVAHVGLTGAFLMVNPSLCEILGYAEDELLGRTFQELTHPDDLQPNLELFERLMAGEIDRYQMEKRYLRPTGEVVWADLTVSLERDQSGAPRNFISVVTDISTRKQHEERLNFLMGELAHRSKNLLAVLQSAVRQIGAEARSVTEFRDAVDARITAIAASHDSLARRAYSGAPLAEIIRAQLSAFVRVDPRVQLHGPDVELGAAAAQSLGLALHELATNACKYGALSSQEGRLTIEWAVTPGERLRVVWTERGGPPVEPPTRRGFGRRVIEQMVSAALSAQVELRFDPEGLVWTLEAPLTALRS
jgi:PAS domain S-box-containing protein